MKISKKIVLTAGSFLLGLSLVGCGKTNEAASGSNENSNDIKIGVPAPLSGQSAKMGSDIVNAAKLAASELNEKGGVIGKKIKIVPIDDACDAQVATQAANKLVTSNVDAVVGHYCSSAALPAETVYNENGIPFITPSSSNPQLTEQGFTNVFRMIGRDDQQGKFMADYLVHVQHKKNIAILHDNTTYTKGLAQETKAGVEKLGGKVTFFEAVTPGEKDFSVIISKLKPLKPDAIYWTGFYAEGGLLIKQAKDLGLNVLFAAGDGNNDTTLMKIAGPASEGVIVSTAPTTEFLDNAGAGNFVSKYKETYSEDAGPFSSYTYDGVNIIAEAIKEAKTQDKKKIIDTIHGLKDFQGVTGTINFDEKGDRKGISYITTQVKDGKFEATQK
ncbi:branched-chain amino acid ABC transporter substrate-binding protein [Bacillus xiapuensis]|uniref:Branched-chain amino acid ABC transporter substrate-binding protein n=1 Tax=Bacillus xiapuensis TaxID=2014075 RepID=A0ABU6NCF1_9BACI|nr:branched-chain amino acid ABC transporter substrate-binding protein [Bacillus xiapuensis]